MANVYARGKMGLYRRRVEAIRAAGRYIDEHAEDFIGEVGEVLEDGTLRLGVEFDLNGAILPRIMVERNVIVLTAETA